MKFETLEAFMEMGGHGPYVWAAYAFAFVIIVANFVWPMVIYRRNLAQLRQAYRDEAVREQKEQTA